MADETPLRYYFSGIAVTPSRRAVSAFLIVLNVFLMALSRIVWGYVVFGLFSLGGLHGLLRPSQPGLFVELQNDHLLVNALILRRRIYYRDIASADFYVYRQGDWVRGVLNSAMAFSRIFGGLPPTAAKPGEVDREIVELKYTRTRWVWFPFPPFVLPRSSSAFRVDDPASFRDELRRRLSGLRA